MAHREGRFHRFHVQKLWKKTYVDSFDLLKNQKRIRLEILHQPLSSESWSFLPPSQLSYRNYPLKPQYKVLQSWRHSPRLKRWPFFHGNNIHRQRWIQTGKKNSLIIEKWSYFERCLFKSGTSNYPLQIRNHPPRSWQIHMVKYQYHRQKIDIKKIKRWNCWYDEKYLLLITSYQR